MSEPAKLAPPLPVLQAFGVRGEVAKLEGGQGNVFGTRDIVLKRATDDAEANWAAETHLAIEPRGFRIARPIASDAGSFVVDGWTAWSRLPGEHRLKGGPWPLVVALCAQFHQAVEKLPRPAFLERKSDNFARADRMAWNEARHDLAPEVGQMFEVLAAKVSPAREPAQLIHGDFAGNILFADGHEPAVIDFSPYWRPASYAVALTVVDAVLWYEGTLDLLDELGRLGDARQMVARALMFRLAIDGLFALDQPGVFWSAAIARDLAGARRLLEYTQE